MGWDAAKVTGKVRSSFLLYNARKAEVQTESRANLVMSV